MSIIDTVMICMRIFILRMTSKLYNNTDHYNAPVLVDYMILILKHLLKIKIIVVAVITKIIDEDVYKSDTP